MQDAKNFVEEDPDCLSKIQACDLRKALTDDTFLSSSELVPQKIVRNLIREAKRLDPERTCCDPLGLRQNPSIISAEHELNEGKYDSALEKLEHMPNMTQIYRSNIADIRQRVTQASALDVSNDESEPLLSGLPKND